MSTRAEVVKEGAKVSPIIMWLMYLCNEPETSEINVTKAFPCHCKSTNIPVFPAFYMVTLEQPNHLSSVKKYIY